MYYGVKQNCAFNVERIRKPGNPYRVSYLITIMELLWNPK